MIWITSGSYVSWTDYEGTGQGGNTDPDELLIKGHYTDDTSVYHYATSAVKNGVNNSKYDKFNAYFVMGLMDPATWLEGIKNQKVPFFQMIQMD